MNKDLIKRMADIQRRLLALKAERKVDTSQLNILEESWDYSFTLAKDGDPGDYARFTVVINCGGDPIADVGIDGLPYGNVLVDANSDATLSGDVATYDVLIFNNDSVSPIALTPTIRAFALNGINATCERIV